MEELHGRMYLHTFLLYPTLSPGSLRQLSQRVRLDQVPDLQTSPHHPLAVDLPQLQDIRITIEELAETSPEDIPEESKFLLKINFCDLTKSHIENQQYWIIALQAAITAGR